MINNKSYTWNPDEITTLGMASNDKHVSFKAFRVSSSGYIKKKYVRQYVFIKYNNTCNYCESTKELQVDHIKSVRYCFDNNIIDKCNTLNNLQILCSKCNRSKQS